MRRSLLTAAMRSARVVPQRDGDFADGSTSVNHQSSQPTQMAIAGKTGYSQNPHRLRPLKETAKSDSILDLCNHLRVRGERKKYKNKIPTSSIDRFLSCYMNYVNTIFTFSVFNCTRTPSYVYLKFQCFF